MLISYLIMFNIYVVESSGQLIKSRKDKTMITIADFQQYTTKRLRVLLADYFDDLEFCMAQEYRSRENIDEFIMGMSNWKRDDFHKYCEMRFYEDFVKSIKKH